MRWRYVLAVLYACGATAQAADPEMHWFINQATYDGARILVRSYCEVSRHEHAVVPRNTGCTEQELLIKPLGKPSIKLDYGNRWFTAPAEQGEIRAHEAAWRRLPAVDLPNTIRERKAQE
jgi:hypothetical protein